MVEFLTIFIVVLGESVVTSSYKIISEVPMNELFKGSHEVPAQIING